MPRPTANRLPPHYEISAADRVIGPRCWRCGFEFLWGATSMYRRLPDGRFECRPRLRELCTVSRANGGCRPRPDRPFIPDGPEDYQEPREEPRAGTP
jgi:hypothetical protein